MVHMRDLTSAGSFFMRTMSAAIVAIVVITASASAQYPPNHNFFPGRKCEISANVTLSNGISMTSGGTMDMLVVGMSVEGDDPAWQELTPVSFHSVGTHPMFGSIDWDLYPVPVAMLPKSRIQSNAGAALFPATCDIYFYVEATGPNLSSTYRSTTPVHMRHTNLMSFSPHINETYSLVAPVDFEDVNAPGFIIFTVTGLTSTLN